MGTCNNEDEIIPHNFSDDAIWSDLLKRHDENPSIIAIKENVADNRPSFSFSTVTNSDIYRQVRLLKLNKSSGYDDIPAKIIRFGGNPLIVTCIWCKQ